MKRSGPSKFLVFLTLSLIVYFSVSVFKSLVSAEVKEGINITENLSSTLTHPKIKIEEEEIKEEVKKEVKEAKEESKKIEKKISATKEKAIEKAQETAKVSKKIATPAIPEPEYSPLEELIGECLSTVENDEWNIAIENIKEIISKDLTEIKKANPAEKESIEKVIELASAFQDYAEGGYILDETDKPDIKKINSYFDSSAKKVSDVEKYFQANPNVKSIDPEFIRELTNILKIYIQDDKAYAAELV